MRHMLRRVRMPVAVALAAGLTLVLSANCLAAMTPEQRHSCEEMEHNCGSRVQPDCCPSSSSETSDRIPPAGDRIVAKALVPVLAASALPLGPHDLTAAHRPLPPVHADERPPGVPMYLLASVLLI